MIRVLFATLLLMGIGTAFVSCGGPGNAPKASDGLGY